MSRGRPARKPLQRAPRPWALPLQTKLALLLGWLAVQFVAWQVVRGTAPRLGIALLTLLALPLVVVLLVNPARRHR